MLLNLTVRTLDKTVSVYDQSKWAFTNYIDVILTTYLLTLKSDVISGHSLPLTFLVLDEYLPHLVNVIGECP